MNPKSIYQVILISILGLGFGTYSANAQTSVPGGAVSGTWTTAGSPYLIQGSIEILNDSTLTIQPGVTVNFQGSYQLQVLGRLLAIGANADSIIFTAPDTTTGWLGIRFNNTTSNNDTSKLFYCKLTYSTYAAVVFSNFSKAIISNCRISNNNEGIGCSSSSPYIVYNSIYNNYGSNGSNGGGIGCAGGSPIITNNTITNNTAQGDGGGIYIENSSPYIANNTISNNIAGGQGGGGISCEGNGLYTANLPIITNNIISYNRGGGIYCLFAAFISNNIISYNIASEGGGIEIEQGNGGNLTISNNTISNNFSSGEGGGIRCYPNNVDVVINGNMIADNYSGEDGGGISCIGSSSTQIFNNILCNNNSIEGGALYVEGAASFMNNTIANNSATYGGALYLSNSSPTFENTILSGNTASGGGMNVDLSSSEPNFYYCNVPGGIDSFALNGNFYTGVYHNNIDSNPLFVAPSAGSGTGYNGTTANWSLQPGSPCINTGNLIGTYPTTDIAGNPRVMQCIIDMGAYEYQSGPSPYVSASISTTTTGTVCAGTSFTFTVTSTNTGSSPAYQWRNNGVNIPGQTGLTYTTTSLTNGNAITCVVTSSNACPLGDDSSNKITVSVTPFIHHSISQSVCSGSSYTFGGIAYSASGTYIDTAISAVIGCDSITTLTLTVNPVINKSISRSICTGASYVFGGQTYSLLGTYMDTAASTITGCDSITTLTLSVLPVINQFISRSVCTGGSYSFGGRTYSTPGIYLDTATSRVTGCDSITTLTLSVIPVINQSISQSVCSGSSYGFGGHAYNTSGTYIDTTISTVTGCDSITMLTLSVIPVINQSISQSVCAGSSYGFGGHTYSAPGTYTDTAVSTVTGCDSITTLSLTLKPVINQSISRSVCAGNSYSFGGQNYNSSGTYIDTALSTVTGCDSITTLTLSVRPVINQSTNQSICGGGNYIFGGRTYNTSGIYIDTTTSALTGCDSLTTLILSVIPVINQSISQSICGNGSYTFGGHTYSTSGIYTDTSISTITGCDSITVLILTVTPVINQSISQSVCAGGNYIFGGHTYSASGTYRDTAISIVTGCDSITTLTLFVMPVINQPTTQYVCTGGSYIFGGHTYSTSGTYTDTATSTVTGCDSITTLTLFVTLVINQSIIGNPSITPFQPYTYIVNPTSGITYGWSVTGGAIQSGQSSNNISVIWGNTPPYSVTLVQSNQNGGCADTSTLLVVNSSCSLSVNVISEAKTLICTGDTILLIAQVGSFSTYQWVRNGSLLSGQTGDTVLVTQSGQYQVQVTSGNCTVISNSNNFTFQVSPPTPVVESRGNVGSCISPNIILSTDSNYLGYLWNTGSTVDSINADSSGNYSVIVTGANGCTSLSQPYSLNLSIAAPYQICVVSVDSATDKNIIVWDKPTKFGVDSFLIYKETNQYNVFAKIGAVYVDSFSTFIDQNSIPQQEANRYKIAVLDTCGNITLQSDAHETMHLTINQGLGGVWNLIWNAYQGFTFPSYNIYRGTTSSSLQLIATISSSNTSYTDINPPSFVNYYLVEAINPNGCSPSRSSGYSSSISNIAQSLNTGTISITDNIDWQFYPNPTHDYLVLRNDNLLRLSGYQIKVINTLGQMVLSQELQENETKMDVSSWGAAGVYFLQIQNADQQNVAIKKIILQ